MAFDNSGTKAVAYDHPLKGVNYPPIFAAIGQAVRRWKALNLGSLNIQFQQDWPKDYKNYSFLIFFTRKLRKISLD